MVERQAPGGQVDSSDNLWAAVIATVVAAVSAIAAVLQASAARRQTALSQHQIELLQRQHEDTRRETEARLSDENINRLIAKAEQRDDFAKPVLITIIQLEAICRYFFGHLAPPKQPPVGRFALSAMKARTDDIRAELHAYDGILSVLFANFGTSTEVTSILMRAQRFYCGIMADLAQLGQYEDIPEGYARLIGALDNSAGNFASLVRSLARYVPDWEAIRDGEFNFMHLTRDGTLKEGAPPLLATFDDPVGAPSASPLHKRIPPIRPPAG
jgi:hypothetical protein